VCEGDDESGQSCGSQLLPKGPSPHRQCSIRSFTQPLPRPAQSPTFASCRNGGQAFSTLFALCISLSLAGAGIRPALQKRLFNCPRRQVCPLLETIRDNGSQPAAGSKGGSVDQPWNHQRKDQVDPTPAVTVTQCFPQAILGLAALHSNVRPVPRYTQRSSELRWKDFFTGPVGSL